MSKVKGKKYITIGIRDEEYAAYQRLAWAAKLTVTEQVTDVVSAFISGTVQGMDIEQLVREQEAARKSRAELREAARFLAKKSSYVMPVPVIGDPNPEFADTPQRAMRELKKEMRTRHDD